MARRLIEVLMKVIILTNLLICLPSICYAGSCTIPANPSQVNDWFNSIIKPFSARNGSLDPALVKAERAHSVLKVRKNGGGNFKTVTDALKSIKHGNTRRVIISIGPGVYKEKITIEHDKPFITLYGDPLNKPTLTFDGTAAKYGTVDSASLIVESDYFIAANIIVSNSAPRPDGKRKGAQAVALRISGDKAAFYGCRLLGFQDTLCDDRGNHFFKNCYIEGTVDFIFGDARSLYLNTELHVISGDQVAIITAQAGKHGQDPGGYSFVHCKVTGTGRKAFLGRAWMPAAEVVFAYSSLGGVVNPEGWSDNFKPELQKSVIFGEYNCKGAGANQNSRVKYAKMLSDADAQPYISLDYIDATKWLVPPRI